MEIRQKIEANIGIVTITVEENPTTGYQWFLKECPSEIELISDDFKEEFKEYSTNTRVGSGGIKEFKFKIDKSNTYRIEFEEKRIWETDILNNMIVELNIK